MVKSLFQAAFPDSCRSGNAHFIVGRILACAPQKLWGWYHAFCCATCCSMQPFVITSYIASQICLTKMLPFAAFLDCFRIWVKHCFFLRDWKKLAHLFFPASLDSFLNCFTRDFVFMFYAEIWSRDFFLMFYARFVSDCSAMNRQWWTMVWRPPLGYWIWWNGQRYLQILWRTTGWWSAVPLPLGTRMHTKGVWMCWRWWRLRGSSQTVRVILMSKLLNIDININMILILTLILTFDDQGSWARAKRCVVAHQRVNTGGYFALETMIAHEICSSRICVWLRTDLKPHDCSRICTDTSKKFTNIRRHISIRACAPALNTLLALVCAKFCHAPTDWMYM